MASIPMSSAQIIDDLTARIESGEMAPGEKLPSYQELVELYSISLGTAAKVVLLLRERGLVFGIQGKGVYVAERKS